MLASDFEGQGFLVDFRTIEMPQGHAVVFRARLRLRTQGLGQPLGMVGEVGVADVLLVEVAVDAAGVVEKARLAAETQAIETRQDEADQGAESA